MILRSLVIEATPYQQKGEQCVAVCCSVSQCDCIALCCIYVTFVYDKCQVLVREQREHDALTAVRANQ